VVERVEVKLPPDIGVRIEAIKFVATVGRNLLQRSMNYLAGMGCRGGHGISDRGMLDFSIAIRWRPCAESKAPG
jgi:hypothetical protein